VSIIKKQAIGHAIITYAGLLLGVVNILWLMPKGMLPEEVGLRSIILSSALLISPLARIGFTKVIIKFYPNFKSEKEKDHGFLFLILIIPFITFLLVLALFMLFRLQIGEIFMHKAALLNKYFWYIIPISFFMMYTGILSTYSQVKYKIIIPAIIQRIGMPLFTGILLYLMNNGTIDFNGFMKLLVLCYFAMTLLNIIYLGYLKLLHLKPDLSVVNKKMIKEMLVYGIFVILGGVGAIVSTNISSLMLGAMEGLKNTAIFSIAYFLGTVIDIPRGSLSRIASPIIAEAWHTDQIALIKNIYKKTAINQMIVGCFVFLLIWLNIDNIFHLMPKGAVYQGGKWVVFYIGLAKVIDMATGVNTEILINSEKYKFNFIAVISFTIVVVLTNWILIPLYSYVGAAIALMISFIYFNLIKYIYLLATFKLQPFSFNFLKVLIITAGVYVISSIVPVMPNIFVDIFLRSSIICLLFLAAILLAKPSEDLNIIVTQIKTFIKNK
jgi:O-antigen/teichoic acid export membrane protein